MEGAWTSSYCQNIEGFPRVLHATLQRLGVRERPEYEGREFVSHGTERCRVTVFIAKSETYPEATEGWSVTTTGFRFVDTYQAVARKALRYLCRIYEEPIASTPMRFFPPVDRDRQVWKARMEALQGQDAQGDNPTVVHLTAYLLALDEQYDRQAAKLKECTRRAEEAEIFSRMLEVQMADLEAEVAAAESREAIASEALKSAEDRHAKELSDAYMVARAKRKTVFVKKPKRAILDGIPIHPLSGVLVAEDPPAPPPSEVTDVEVPLALSQPPPKEEACPQHKPRSRSLDVNEVD